MLALAPASAPMTDWITRNSTAALTSWSTDSCPGCGDMGPAFLTDVIHGSSERGCESGQNPAASRPQRTRTYGPGSVFGVLYIAHQVLAKRFPRQDPHARVPRLWSAGSEMHLCSQGS